MGLSRRGRSHSEEHNKKISNKLKGHPNFNKELRGGFKVGHGCLFKGGRNPLSKEGRNRIRLARTGENCNFWKGGITKDRKNYRKIYYTKNKLAFKTYGARRRNLENSLSIADVQDVYEENIKYFGELTCYLCLKPIEFGQDSLEHKQPLSRGGINARDNLAIAHRSCNCKKNDKTLEEFINAKS
jgi:5-methylcytosine-specific restriction endonuclease McrA